MALTYKRIAVVGSREFTNYLQLKRTVMEIYHPEDDWLVSGGAVGADSMAQRLAKEKGGAILVFYPLWHPGQNVPLKEERDKSLPNYDAGAGFKRNKKIVENSDIVLAFYQKGKFQQGGTANTAAWARKLGKELREYEQE